MKVEKKVVANLNKCYAISELPFKGQHCFLVAAEKQDPCYLFSEDGGLLDTVWKEPGGVMTMAPVPGADGQFLATHRFYSPNDSLEAKIVIVTYKEDGNWEVRTLCKAPFVHRFGILSRGGVNYLIVCCLKTGHEYKNDWRFPGACFGAELPADLSSFDEDHPLALTLIKDGMLKNHGYSLIRRGGHDAALVGCEQGTFVFNPPAVRGADWEVEQILSIPSSDSVLIDFDGDGRLELGCISPFHGNSLTIYHLDEHGNYVPQWKYGHSYQRKEIAYAQRTPSPSHGTRKQATTAPTSSTAIPAAPMPFILSIRKARTSSSAPTARSMRSRCTLSQSKKSPDIPEKKGELSCWKN